LLLAVVFGLAALAKLADRAGSRQAVLEFGVPRSLAGPVAFALPIAELTAAGLLIPTATAVGGAFVALALLVLFIAGISVNLARGRNPDCHCFGQLHSTPVGWTTLARNIVLAGAAVAIAIPGPGSGHEAFGWVADLRTGEAVALAIAVGLLPVVLALGWAVINLLQQNGRLLVRIEALEQKLGQPPAAVPAGLQVGDPAPDFAIPDLDGETVTLERLTAPGKPVLLLFTAAHCEPCTALVPEIGRWQGEHGDALTIVVVTTRQEDEAPMPEFELNRVLVQENTEVSAAYHAWATPSAVVVTPQASIASSLAAGPDQIRKLVDEWASGVPLTVVSGNGEVNSSRQSGAGFQVGEALPSLKLSDLSGETIDLAELKGTATVLLFWSPQCGYCQQMLPDLKACEADHRASDPNLVLISSGSVEANREMDLRSRIALDQGFRAGRLLGVPGTPTGVLIDAEGKVASTPAVGIEAVMAMCRGQPAASAAG
jgi:peroxiredoxin